MLAAYLGYWSAIEKLDDIPAAQRAEVIRPYAADPAFSKALDGFSHLDGKNQKFYGQEHHKATVISVTASLASVSDCADTSNYGLLDKSTGKKLNRGTPASLTKAVLIKSGAGSWQVSQIDVATGAC